MPPLIIKEEMDVMDSVYEFEDKIMFIDMLEDIRDGSQSHLKGNRRNVHYKVCSRI